MGRESVSSGDIEPEPVSRPGKLIGGNASVWHRIGLLLGVLFFLKLMMLVVHRRHLFQAHWRIGGEQVDWAGHAGLYAFALLVGGHLWVMGSRCRPLGVRAVRVANCFVLTLATLFIFLTFHEGDKNYLHPVMTGILNWTDLGSYLALNFFFRPPFLAGWLLAYAVVYYAMARAGRESHILRATAIFGAAYVAVCLNELARYRSALVIADCLGAACLLGALWNRRALGVRWLLLVACAAASLFVLFRSSEAWVANPNPFFQTIAGTVVVIVTGLSLLAWRRGFHPAWSWLVPFAFAAILLLGNANYPMAANYQNLLRLGLTLPRYFLGELALVTGLLIAAIVYRRWRPAGSLLWLDAVCVAVAGLALVDLKLSSVMGVRLDWEVLAFADSPKMMWRMSRPYLPFVVGVLALLIGSYVFGLWLLNRRQSPSVGGVYQRGAWPVLAGIVLLGLAGLWLAEPDKVQGQTISLLAKSSPLWRVRSVQAMERKAFLGTAERLGMGRLGEPQQDSSTGPSGEMNVVLILQESTFNKHLSLFGSEEETQPLLSQYKDRMEVFPHFFANYAGSIHARFAAFAGLYPVRDFHSFTRERVQVKSLFEVLNENGYSCSMFYSSFFDYTSFRDFLRGRGLDEMYDADTMPGQREKPSRSWGLREEETLAAIQGRIRKYAADQSRFFLTYIPAAPHYPYDGVPDRFRKHPAKEIGDYAPLFLNELLYMDWVIASIVDELKANGLLDNTLVIITSDHGELLGGEDGAIGHGWAVTPELANVPLIIMNPHDPGYRVNETVGSHVDLLPTVLDILNVPMSLGHLYQGASLYRADSGRMVYLNSYRDYAILQGGTFFCGSRESNKRGTASGGGTTFALENVGARPFFLKTETQGSPPVSIAEFDRFQESFLGHYAVYCEMAGMLEAARK